ncbi:Hok/Gef family protein [Escherichia coli]|nr:Hok/Gef family protein [Escherichia coli]HEG7758704.1 Hok/Gef family protein [Escherichia coli]HEG7861508.1 Hok/Gef family protein [Escherichia coli]
MPQKTIIVSILCITILMIVWMIHNSHCEFRLNVMWSQFAAFLLCKQ